MQTNKHIELGSELQQRGQELLDAAHAYWEVYQRALGRGAVVWLENNNGHFVLFTRSEYKEAIMAAAYRETRNEEALFEPFTDVAGQTCKERSYECCETMTLEGHEHRFGYPPISDRELDEAFRQAVTGG